MRQTHRGQNTVECIVLAVVTVAAVVGMQTYIRRGVQARLKATTDDLLRIAGDDGSGEATQRRGIGSARLLEADLVCPSGTIVQGGVSCTESQQTRDVAEATAASGGTMTKLTTEAHRAVSSSIQLFRELRGPAPPAPEPPPEAPEP